MPPQKPERDFPAVCPRCRHKTCKGRFLILTCKVEYDGKTAMDEAEEYMRGLYVAPETAVVDEVTRPELMQMHFCSDILVPWEADKDRRPRARGGAREGARWVSGQGFVLPGSIVGIGSSSAMHGECTECVRDAHDDHSKTIRAATWRRQNGPLPENFHYCKASYCDMHAKRFASAPIQVPEFTNAEDAQAWLDKITEEIHA